MHTLTKYILGFVLSIILTLAAFSLKGVEMAVPILITLATVQLLVQLVLFLHVGSEQKPRWNLAALALALIIVAILVGGTLWIMNNLAHNQETPNMMVEENIFPHTE